MPDVRNRQEAFQNAANNICGGGEGSPELEAQEIVAISPLKHTFVAYFLQQF